MTDSPEPLANTTQTIAPRFQGPPTSGNGGYSCGVLAAQLGPDADAVSVTLRAPPPLATAMDLRREDGTVSMWDGDTLVAEATSSTLSLDLPNGPSFGAATEAASRFRGFDQHIFPACFVCGPAREHGDGLCIFAGPLADRPEVVAASWCPDQSLADDGGKVGAEYLWAALDCPGYFALAQPNMKALLGRMTASVIDRPAAGTRCVVVGWRIASDGRKHDVGTAVFNEDGSVYAFALARWIELR